MENKLIYGLCKELASIRTERGLSLDVVADVSNIHKSTLSKYERGLLSPKINTVEVWAESLGHEVCASLRKAIT
jgi:transcriptional regulator with XRE-family HTH domain